MSSFTTPLLVVPRAIDPQVSRAAAPSLLQQLLRSAELVPFLADTLRQARSLPVSQHRQLAAELDQWLAAWIAFGANAPDEMVEWLERLVAVVRGLICGDPSSEPGPAVEREAQAYAALIAEDAGTLDSPVPVSRRMRVPVVFVYPAGIPRRTIASRPVAMLELRLVPGPDAVIVHPADRWRRSLRAGGAGPAESDFEQSLADAVAAARKHWSTQGEPRRNGTVLWRLFDFDTHAVADARDLPFNWQQPLSGPSIGGAAQRAALHLLHSGNAPLDPLIFVLAQLCDASGQSTQELQPVDGVREKIENALSAIGARTPVLRDCALFALPRSPASADFPEGLSALQVRGGVNTAAELLALRNLFSPETKVSSHRMTRGIAAVLLASIVLGGGLWWQQRNEARIEQQRLSAQMAQLSAQMARIQTERESQRRYIRTVADVFTEQKAELDRLKVPEDEQFRRALSQVAEKEGIPFDQLQAGINLFVAVIARDPHADFYDRALAEFAKRDFAASQKAARQAAETAEQRLTAIGELEHRLATEKTEALRQVREARELEGNAAYARSDYAGATAAFAAALAATPRESHPEDWARLQFGSGLAFNDWAARSEGDAIAERRGKAVSVYREALTIYTRDALPQDWARTQNNLAIALSDQASASDGPNRSRLLAEAVSAYREALTIRTRDALPQDWAMTQNNLATALRGQASASDGPNRSRLLAEAVSAYREALTIRTRDALPQDWAMTQNNLASALSDQASASDGPNRSRLLAEAVSAYREALTIYTRDALPQDWAMTQNNLANALRGQASASDGPNRSRLLAEAVSAYREALTIYTRDALPQHWARTQNNLAIALSDQASASDGPNRSRLLAEAVSAYREALTIYTRDALPQDWAMTQNNLAVALRGQASASDGPNRSRLLAEAVSAYREALTIRTRDALPQDWARTQNNLAIALSDQASASDGPNRSRLLAEAVSAYREALTIYTRDALPQDWATTQNNLANALSDQASASDGPNRSRLLAEAVSAYREALTIYTRDALPQDWAMTQNNLASALSDQASASDGPNRSRLLAEAVSAYREALTIRTRDALPQAWARTQNNLAVALRDQASASDGPNRSRLLAEAVSAYREALTVRTHDALPQDWARTQNNLALAYRDQANAVVSLEKAPFLREAAAAMRGSLEILTDDQDPQKHAMRTAWIADVEKELTTLTTTALE